MKLERQSVHWWKGILFALSVGLLRVLMWWTVEWATRFTGASARVQDEVHSMVAFSLWVAVGWYFWRSRPQITLTRRVEDQVRQAVQVLTYVTALEEDPVRKEQLRAVEERLFNFLLLQRQREKEKNEKTPLSLRERRS